MSVPCHDEPKCSCCPQLVGAGRHRQWSSKQIKLRRSEQHHEEQLARAEKNTAQELQLPMLNYIKVISSRSWLPRRGIHFGSLPWMAVLQRLSTVNKTLTMLSVMTLAHTALERKVFTHSTFCALSRNEHFMIFFSLAHVDAPFSWSSCSTACR